MKEIHFVNQYRFDDHVLKRLIKQIERKDNKLKQITFSYFDYNESYENNKPLNDKIFIDPKYLNKAFVDKLCDTAKLNWRIEHGPIDQAGYKIIVKQRE